MTYGNNYSNIEVTEILEQGIPEILFLKPRNKFPLFASEQSHQTSKDFSVFLGSEEPNPDEVLRQIGVYDSTDKRCCIHQKEL